MELICPSCEARYQVPDGSIGEKGRQVSCLNCGAVWHAFPPLVLGNGDTSASAPRGLNWQGPEGMPRPPSPTPVPAGSASDAPAAPAAAAPEPRLAGSEAASGADRMAASRSEQLAEIREMLAEVQSEDRAQAAMSPGAKPIESDTGAVPLTASNAAVAAAAVESGPIVDPRVSEAREREVQSMVRAEEEAFRERAERLQNRPNKAKQTDVKKLERSHKRRHARIKNAKAAGSGAFMTGLLLVVMIAAVMIALYLLHPQIIERMPGSEAALNEYVATIDSMRVSLAETFSGLRDWVGSRLDQNA